jgi:hypothetical protein
MGFVVIMSLMCADSNGKTQTANVSVDFGTDERYYEEEDTMFDNMIHVFNDYLESSGHDDLFVDDTIECYSMPGYEWEGKIDLVL